MDSQTPLVGTSLSQVRGLSSPVERSFCPGSGGLSSSFLVAGSFLNVESFDSFI